MLATGKVVLDTSVAVAHLRGVTAATARLQSYENESLLLPTVALGELLHGARKSARGAENLSNLKTWLQTVTLLPLTETTANCYASIKLGLSRAGTPIPENDIWIAAHAVEHDLPLATSDEHFQRIADLVVLDWR